MQVLLIDELAVLTAYASKQVQSEASDLLRRVVTQGRALGVFVVAFVQDPRKETVAMRGLFTQTVAPRLRSVSETAMVLGEGMADVTPAHQISPAHPGTGYAVADDGNVERVRADFWEDTFIRMVAETYPAPDRYVPPPIFVGPPTPNTDDKATTPTRVPAEEQRAPVHRASRDPFASRAKRRPAPRPPLRRRMTDVVPAKGGFPGFGLDAPLDLGNLTPAAVAGIAARLRDRTAAAFSDAAARTGFCSHPIRLRGSSTTVDAATGEVLSQFSSDDAPLGLLHRACGNRRESVCPACSRVYRPRLRYRPADVEQWLDRVTDSGTAG